MPRFQSILSRIVILHIVAVVITSILMSVGLSWLLSYATNNIHNEAMQEQANEVASHLSVGPDGRLQLNLPSDLLGLYSPEYGRYSYAVLLFAPSQRPSGRSARSTGASRCCPTAITWSRWAARTRWSSSTRRARLRLSC